MEGKHLTGITLSLLWKAFVSIGSALAFYLTYLEPKLKMILQIDLLEIGTTKFTERIGDEYREWRTLELKVTLKEQLACEFMVWVNRTRVHGVSESPDGGKTYKLTVDLPEHLVNSEKAQVAIKRLWPIHYLAAKTVRLHPTMTGPQGL